MIALSIGLALVLLVIILLYTPLNIAIDTRSNLYQLRWRGLFKANIEYDAKEVIRARVTVLFMTFRVFPLNYMSSNRKAPKKRAGSKKRRRRMSFNKVLRIVRSFKVDQFVLNLDTGSVLLNARLYPLVALLQHFRHHIGVNFTGQNVLVLRIRNRPIDILKAFL